MQQSSADLHKTKLTEVEHGLNLMSNAITEHEHRKKKWNQQKQKVKLKQEHTLHIMLKYLPISHLFSIKIEPNDLATKQ